MTIALISLILVFIVMWFEILFFAAIIVWVLRDPPAEKGGVSVQSAETTYYPMFMAEPVISSEIPTQPVQVRPVVISDIPAQPEQVSQQPTRKAQPAMIVLGPAERKYWQRRSSIMTRQ